ncbi:hypothetical protein OEZ86_010599 [Tetradesmus obliquus]|nr:hypothetical protein OEZ86_010599 [Tetradesmus obliquus]
MATILKALTLLLVVVVSSSLVLLLSSLSGEQLSAYQLHLTVAKETLNRGWQRNFHRLAGMHWDIRHAAGMLPNETRSQLAPLWNYTFSLPQPQLQRSLVYIGPNHRLRRVLLGLQQGQPTKVGVIGGSISHGASASKIGQTDWFSLVGKFMVNSYPQAKVTLRNGCLPATPSALMEMCLEQSVDADVDLLFIEYVANDGANRFDETKAKVYERLLRKTLTQPKKPAVLLVQLMPKGAAFSPSNKEKVHYFHTLEDNYGALAQYYDAPWLSWRNSVWRLGELHRYGYNWTDFMWNKDFMHPIDAGHKAIADVVVYAIQQSALQLAMSPYGVPDLDLLLEPLPAPMFPGNYEGKNRLCVYGEAFRSTVVNASGWSFIDEGGPGKRKWGYIATKPDSLLSIKLDTRRTSSTPSTLAGRMNVMLSYLRSYENMGSAWIFCLAGCKCASQTINAHHTLRQSTVFLARLLPTEHAECVIGVKVLRNTTSGKHKFKVNGLMMNEYTGSDVATRVHEERWLHQMLSINDPNAVPQGGARAKAPAKRAAAAAMTPEAAAAAAAGKEVGSSAGQALQHKRQRQQQQQSQQGG